MTWEITLRTWPSIQQPGGLLRENQFVLEQFQTEGRHSAVREGNISFSLMNCFAFSVDAERGIHASVILYEGLFF